MVRGVKPEIAVRLERWIDPSSRGFFSGDHHIHAAGCAHYTSPTEGVEPSDMFRQIKGEGLNVGSVLTWGPGFDHQKQFFAPMADKRSEPLTLMKYDIEVSGFGSEALGHVCLINLKEQIYPGANGSKDWPTWTLPVLRWTKQQGGVGGYAHSGSGLQIDPEAATGRLLNQLDADQDGRLDAGEAARGLLPERFADIDTDRDGTIARDPNSRPATTAPTTSCPTGDSGAEQRRRPGDLRHRRAWRRRFHQRDGHRSHPGMERVVSPAQCGFPLKASGETDFPCMSGTRVGQGRTYVHLGSQTRVDYAQWAQGIARGRSYVSDGYAHALDFAVDGKASGDELQLAGPRTVTAKAVVAFSPETPLEPPYGGAIPVGGRRHTATRSSSASRSRSIRATNAFVGWSKSWSMASRSRAARCRQMAANIPSSSPCRSIEAAG